MLYENLNPNLIIDNKTFWKQVNHFFSDKTPTNNNITQLEGTKISLVPPSELCSRVRH